MQRFSLKNQRQNLGSGKLTETTKSATPVKSNTPKAPTSFGTGKRVGSGSKTSK